LAELIRRGRELSRIQSSESAFPCFAVSEHAAPITLEQTLEAEDEL
jgi:hypothetical protein